ncbi:salutaridinol 7-O-acetyltransferase-like [Papaver somniferum]|nr:salutaridinol 7-O-acetyltransferase-like [Papaver somniferum]
MVRHAVNLRRRLDPPLPDVSFGNLIEFTKAVVGASRTKTTTQETTSSSSTILYDDLNEFVGQLRESISKMTKGNHDFDAENTDYEGKNLWMSSWCNYGLYDIDFGWGKPIWVTAVATIFPDSKGFFLMNDTRCGEGVEVWGNLVEEEMSNFQLNLSELLDRI